MHPVENFLLSDDNNWTLAFRKCGLDGEAEQTVDRKRFADEPDCPQRRNSEVHLKYDWTPPLLWEEFAARDHLNEGILHCPVVNEKYMAYYELLSNGFDRLVDAMRSRGLSLDMHTEDLTLQRGDTSLDSSGCEETNGLRCQALRPELYYQYNSGSEIYSRRVFVGGLPVDADESEIVSVFARFGHLSIGWPNKQFISFPSKGYAFLVFQNEQSVHCLVQACITAEDRFYFPIPSTMNPHKVVQIRPWKLADADYVVDVNIPLNPRNIIFVGGVPRPMRAVELAHIMDKLYGPVVCTSIDTDMEHKYPKGAGRVAFANDNSFLRAIRDRFAQPSHGERVRMEMKPYVLDDQSCEECHGDTETHAPFFCSHLECLQYYCEACWTALHSSPSMENHRPLIKEA